MQKIISLDMVEKIKPDDNVKEKVKELLGEFLLEVSRRIDKLPAKIEVSIMADKDSWHFLAMVE